jgi:hypothetical protein
MKLETWLTLGAVLGVGYLAYKGTKLVGEATGAAYSGAVNWTSDLLTSWFGPDLTGTNVYHTVTFPDGSRHAVGADRVDSSGKFVWTGYPMGSQAPVNYQLGQNSAGMWFAVGA